MANQYDYKSNTFFSSFAIPTGVIFFPWIVILPLIERALKTYDSLAIEILITSYSIIAVLSLFLFLGIMLFSARSKYRTTLFIDEKKIIVPELYFMPISLSKIKKINSLQNKNSGQRVIHLTLKRIPFRIKIKEGYLKNPDEINSIYENLSNLN